MEQMPVSQSEEDVHDWHVFKRLRKGTTEFTIFGENLPCNFSEEVKYIYNSMSHHR